MGLGYFAAVLNFSRLAAFFRIHVVYVVCVLASVRNSLPRRRECVHTPSPLVAIRVLPFSVNHVSIKILFKTFILEVLDFYKQRKGKGDDQLETGHAC
jgi:hypothetical protein